jgi:transcriptional regulator
VHAPSHFRVDDPARLWGLVEELAWGSVFSTGGDGTPYATLVPWVRRDGRLLGHMARANRQWRTFDGGRPVLCQFAGEHGYISPAWYSETHHVPTWNYVQVQVRGRPRLLEGDEARHVVEETVGELEGRREDPWPIAHMAATIDKLLPGIAAFEVLDPQIEGSWKLSQNKTAADREGVIAALGATGHGALAALMRQEHHAAARSAEQ